MYPIFPVSDFQSMFGSVPGAAGPRRLEGFLQGTPPYRTIHSPDSRIFWAAMP
jgi:hypothetical protein